MSIVLHQFAFSHFNEKARWALAHKQVGYERKTYLPGPHMPVIKKLSGQPQTPVLQIEDEIVTGSAPIIDALEVRFKEHPLYPTTPAEREQALAYQSRFDAELGPAVRTVLFAELINYGGYMTRMFGQGKSALKRMAYRATYPMAKPLIAKGNGVDDPDNVSRAREIVREYLDQVATDVADTGHLVGSEFTVADLTAAALIAPIADVAHVDMARPQPMPKDIADLIASYSAHPTIQWVNRIYEEYRTN